MLLEHRIFVNFEHWLVRMVNLSQHGQQSFIPVLVLSCTCIPKRKPHSHHPKCGMLHTRVDPRSPRMRNHSSYFILVSQLKRSHLSTEEMCERGVFLAAQYVNHKVHCIDWGIYFCIFIKIKGGMFSVKIHSYRDWGI